ncbi:MAG TPA: hypothetical protein VFE24_11430 [Pirellulales bacterium]|nr:hypothetical protein [Pirellulales bacterium]
MALVWGGWQAIASAAPAALPAVEEVPDLTPPSSALVPPTGPVAASNNTIAPSSGRAKLAPPEQAPAPVAPSAAESSTPIIEHHEVAKDAPIEVIQERYPNRAVKVERQVTQDTDGNYINHGSWTMWDDKGRMVATGEFRNGVRHGAWSRWYGASEGEMFNAPLYKLFQAPFMAEANFVDGKLHGTWVVYDSKKRKCSEWNFENGERQGKSVTYFPSGNKMTEVEYKDGQINGDTLEWNAEGKQVAKETYMDGRRLAAKVDYYSPGVKRFEGVYLYARQINSTNYDWWNGKISVTAAGKEGIDQRHGMWTSWYRNGQKQLEGRYVEDAPVGKFHWWHPNGQKAIEGEYINGKQTSKWTWWHINGQKNIEGEYTNGNPSSKWTWWREDGHVTKVADMSLEHGDSAPLVSDAPTEELQHDAGTGPTLQALPQSSNLPEGHFRR